MAKRCNLKFFLQNTVNNAISLVMFLTKERLATRGIKSTVIHNKLLNEKRNKTHSKKYQSIKRMKKHFLKLRFDRLVKIFLSPKKSLSFFFRLTEKTYEGGVRATHKEASKIDSYRGKRESEI